LVFLLNRYFAEMGHAVEAAGGRVDKFIGDGVMALFGLDSGVEAGCREALAAAKDMAERMQNLNRALVHDLPEPLRIGIGHPELVRPVGSELPIHLVQRTWRRLVADRGLHPLPSDNPLQTHRPHEPCDGAPSNRDAFARQLPPDLADPIDAVVLRENPPDVDRPLGVPLRPLRQPIRIGFPAGMFVPS